MSWQDYLGRRPTPAGKEAVRGSDAGFELGAAGTAIATRFKALVVDQADLDAREQRCDDLLDHEPRLPEGLRHRLKEDLRGGQLWAHQAKAIKGVLDGHDVVVETETASGKSLCYQVPILASLQEDRSATAIYVAPQNALVDDQLHNLNRRFGDGSELSADAGSIGRYVTTLRVGDEEVLAGRFDGDVPQELRGDFRSRRPRYLITNPEMLHMSMLTHHREGWLWVFENLRFLVLDEMHLYRGLFGANVANVVRRVLRVSAYHARRLGREPHAPRLQVVGCSASIATPAEHFAKLTGRAPGVVVAAADSGAPRRRRKTFLLDGTQFPGPISELATEILETLDQQGARTVAFARSIQETNRILRSAHTRLGLQAVRQFKRELPSDEKRDVLEGLRTGAVRAVVSSSALEVGVDIGQLNAVVVCKFPGDRASLRQQLGRAGRDSESIAIIVADGSAADRFYAARSDLVLRDEQSLDVAYLNPDHPDVLRAHLLCAGSEVRLRLRNEDEGHFEPFRDAEGVLDVVATLLDEGLLRPTDHGLVATGSRGACLGEVKMRGTNADFPIFESASRKILVAKPDIGRVQRHFHVGARFQIQDRMYEVDRIEVADDWRGGVGYASLVEPTYWTSSRGVLAVKSLAAEQSRMAGRCRVWRGSVRLTSSVDTMFIHRRSQAPATVRLGDQAPPPRRWDTDGLWLDVIEAGLGEVAAPAAVSAAHALLVGAALVCSTDRADLVANVGSADEGVADRIFLADSNPGGDGLTRAAFASFDVVATEALRLLRDCPHCSSDPSSRGCPSCVSAQWGTDSDVDRIGGIQILERLVDEA